MSRKHLYSWMPHIALALFLGCASEWPLRAPDQWGHAGIHTLFFLLILLFFFRLLPKKLSLPWQIFAAMIAGAAAGWILTLLGKQQLVSGYLAIFGTLFILLLKVFVVPLIFVSVLCGVAGIGDVRALGKLGVKAIGYYLLTTAIAVLIGITVVNVIQPGIGRAALKEDLPTAQTSLETASIGETIQEKVLPTVIQNPVMAGQNPLVIIFFALLLGAGLAALGQEGEPAIRVFRSLDKALITIILWVMLLAPIGVFALMARAIAELGIQYILTLAKYCFTVLLGLGIHFAVLTLFLCPVLGGVSPRRFLTGMAPAFGVSFSTSSSSATLPVTIRCASKRIGADEDVCNFMLPIGATINMDGTALYLSVASIFIAQVYGIHLQLPAQCMIFLTAILVSVGTAGIPGASLGLMSIILLSAGIPPEGIGIVAGVDRLLDMTRTVVNITGDSVGAVVVSRSEGRLGSPVQDEP